MIFRVLLFIFLGWRLAYRVEFILSTYHLMFLNIPHTHFLSVIDILHLGYSYFTLFVLAELGLHSMNSCFSQAYTFFVVDFGSNTPGILELDCFGRDWDGMGKLLLLLDHWAEYQSYW